MSEQVSHGLEAVDKQNLVTADALATLMGALPALERRPREKLTRQRAKRMPRPHDAASLKTTNNYSV